MKWYLSQNIKVCLWSRYSPVGLLGKKNDRNIESGPSRYSVVYSVSFIKIHAPLNYWIPTFLDAYISRDSLSERKNWRPTAHSLSWWSYSQSCFDVGARLLKIAVLMLSIRACKNDLGQFKKRYLQITNFCL